MGCIKGAFTGRRRGVITKFQHKYEAKFKTMPGIFVQQKLMKSTAENNFFLFQKIEPKPISQGNAKQR